jgi:hypothetical protein
MARSTKGRRAPYAVAEVVKDGLADPRLLEQGRPPLLVGGDGALAEDRAQVARLGVHPRIHKCHWVRRKRLEKVALALGPVDSPERVGNLQIPIISRTSPHCALSAWASGTDAVVELVEGAQVALARQFGLRRLEAVVHVQLNVVRGRGYIVGRLHPGMVPVSATVPTKAHGAGLANPTR